MGMAMTIVTEVLLVYQGQLCLMDSGTCSPLPSCLLIILCFDLSYIRGLGVGWQW